MSMLRHRAGKGPLLPTRLLYSARSLDDVIYRKELEERAANDPTLEVILTLTRIQPPDWKRYARRVDVPMLREVAAPLGTPAIAYVCGPTMLVEAVANYLLEIGFAPEHVLTERFGPAGNS
jgi:ferredoxin-NADP reductase